MVLCFLTEYCKNIIAYKSKCFESKKLGNMKNGTVLSKQADFLPMFQLCFLSNLLIKFIVY